MQCYCNSDLCNNRYNAATNAKGALGSEFDRTFCNSSAFSGVAMMIVALAVAMK